jgi:hypothetical protein
LGDVNKKKVSLSKKKGRKKDTKKPFP